MLLLTALESYSHPVQLLTLEVICEHPLILEANRCNLLMIGYLSLLMLSKEKGNIIPIEYSPPFPSQYLRLR